MVVYFMSKCTRPAMFIVVLTLWKTGCWDHSGRWSTRSRRSGCWSGSKSGSVVGVGVEGGCEMNARGYVCERESRSDGA